MSISSFESLQLSSTSNSDNARRPLRKKKRGADQRCSMNRQEDISRALIHLIVRNQLPLSFAESEGFRQFMTIIEPGYVFPTTKMILSRLQLIYKDIKTVLQHEMQRQGTNISSSTDIWTSLSQDLFLSITVHYIDKDSWELKNHTLCTIGLEERYTVENIAAGLKMAYTDWDIERQICTIIHDNIANMINTRDTVQSMNENVKCAAQTLQLVVNDALQLEEVAHIIQNARKIVSYFKQSTLAMQELRDTQIKLNLPEEVLIQSYPERWDSIYHMCERLQRNKSPILAVLHNTSVTPPVQAQKLEITASEWSIIEKLVIILKPLQRATNIFCSSSEVTISLVRPIIRSIMDNHLVQDILDEDFLYAMKEMLRKSLIKHFDMAQSNKKLSVYQIASFLDPRYKDLAAEPHEKDRLKIREFIKEKLQILAPPDVPEENSPAVITALDFIFWKSTSNTESNWLKQLDHYQMEIAIGHNESPLEWWKVRASKYPLLAELARKYLALPATFASSKRTFSSAGNILMRKLSCLSPETVNLLVFLYENRHHIYKK